MIVDYRIVSLERKMSVFTYICTLYTQNKLAWTTMLVVYCFAYEKQKNIESDIFLSRPRGDSMLIQMTDSRRFWQIRPKRNLNNTPLTHSSCLIQSSCIIMKGTKNMLFSAIIFFNISIFLLFPRFFPVIHIVYSRTRKRVIPVWKYQRVNQKP